ncbi:hypothetical protein GCM10007304_14140 [Rhodococcoides trifolii]|uniref:Uncharacterized protein n=1 Tax=Rhodococcoides trifolii TaxID=908250 RepID=A0A917CYR6_9NOCA|nr:hypothetical protein [Rhodococcus trifolii]GGG01333.1 hypothetical protein GCM10007304_14140 [Rhodococcus trifolii]
MLDPLATGTALAVEHIAPLMRLLAAHLPTLDITPMLNPATGCITAPGSACREGGHRILLGTLDDAVDALTVRSEPGLVARMIATLGGGTTPHNTTQPGAAHAEAVRAAAAALDHDDRTTGTGEHERLSSVHQRRSPIPAAVAAYAATGHLDPTRWRSHSEARQSVLTHAVMRGASTADVLDALPSPEWSGVRAAYARYADPDTAAARDVTRALTWAAATAEEFRHPTHENKHTGGHSSFIDDPVRRRWLAHSLVWADHEFTGTKIRWSVAAVLQALAYASGVAGELVDGVPVVAMGGRGLSHAAGLMTETTVFAVLRMLREREGSPLLLVTRGAGHLADRYALTTPTAAPPTTAQIAAARVEAVHPAWSVLGLRCRRLYDEIAARQNDAALRHPPPNPHHDTAVRTGCTAANLFAAARIGTSSGYDILADLTVAGLVTSPRPGTYAAGPRTLDDIAVNAGIARIRRDRITRHRAERLLWRAWLEQRFAPPPPDTAAPHHDSIPTVPDDASALFGDEERYWTSLMATGPPDHHTPDTGVETTATAIALLGHLLGARILT